MVAVAVLCLPVFLGGRRVSRLEGGVFVASYVIYIATLTVTRSG
jgi:cation:H+ antiporter